MRNFVGAYFFLLTTSDGHNSFKHCPKTSYEVFFDVYWMLVSKPSGRVFEMQVISNEGVKFINEWSGVFGTRASPALLS